MERYRSTNYETACLDDFRQELQRQLDKEAKALEEAFVTPPGDKGERKKRPALRPKKPKRKPLPCAETAEYGPGDYLNPVQAAEVLRLAKHTLDNLRSKGTGPVYTKFCGRIRYLYADLLDFVEAGRRRSTSEPGNRPAVASTKKTSPLDVISPIDGGR